MQIELTKKQKDIIFWASFLALLAAGVGFGIRVMNIGTWMGEFGISGKAAGGIFGASLWPIAIGMILFSLIVDKIGYRISMILAFACQVLSVVWTFTSKDPTSLTYSFILAGFGHGIIEACINPLCATMYKKDKSKMLNILHASWPAGVALGAMFCLLAPNVPWRAMFWAVAIPAAMYGVVFFKYKKYPQDERVENNVSYLEMLREFGGLSIFLAATFLIYELGGVFGFFGNEDVAGLITDDGTVRLLICLAIGALVGLVSGFLLKSKGKVLFFILCIIMIPLATAEIATDGWIKKLMEPMLDEQWSLNSGWAIVLSSVIMMVLRFFAGVPLKHLSPPAVLFASSCFSIAGLFLLSEVNGIMILVAFILYGVGQTFYWPTVLGFTAEQFPKGGAMTLNTVSAMGLLTVGIFGMPFLGAVGDMYDGKVAKAEKPELLKVEGYNRNMKTKEVAKGPVFAKNGEFFGAKYDAANMAALVDHESFTTPEAKKLMAIVTAGAVPNNDQIAHAELGKKDLKLLTEKIAARDGKPTGDESELIAFFEGEIKAGVKPSDKAIEAAKSAKDELTALAKAKKRYNENGMAFLGKINENQRKVLKWAAGLPLIMGISFLIMIFYYKSKGGYKPVHLDEADYADGKTDEEIAEEKVLESSWE